MIVLFPDLILMIVISIIIFFIFRFAKGKGKLNGKLRTSHLVFMAAFSATINTFLTPEIQWGNRFFYVLFSGLITMVGGGIAFIIFKND